MIPAARRRKLKRARNSVVNQSSEDAKACQPFRGTQPISVARYNENKSPGTAAIDSPINVISATSELMSAGNFRRGALWSFSSAVTGFPRRTG
jgi:hypothetical protein